MTSPPTQDCIGYCWRFRSLRGLNDTCRLAGNKSSIDQSAGDTATVSRSRHGGNAELLPSGIASDSPCRRKSRCWEEQTADSNNLDLNQIDDPEVITLYRSILGRKQVEISDREQVVIGEQFSCGIQRKMGTDIFVIVYSGGDSSAWVRDSVWCQQLVGLSI